MSLLSKILRFSREESEREAAERGIFDTHAIADAQEDI